MLGATMRVVAANDGTEIGIDNFKFAPTLLMVPKGATVTWVNRDDIPHSIVCHSRFWCKLSAPPHEGQDTTRCATE